MWPAHHLTEIQMTRCRILLPTIAMLVAALAEPLSAQQPGMGGMAGMPHMQQHMTQMQDMMKQMDVMMQQLQQMQAHMKQQPMQMPAQGAASHAAMGQMADHMNGMVTHMKGLAEQMQGMMRDDALMKDRSMRHDMDAMQSRMAEMSKQLSRLVDTMDAMHKRMGMAPGPATKP